MCICRFMSNWGHDFIFCNCVIKSNNFGNLIFIPNNSFTSLKYYEKLFFKTSGQSTCWCRVPAIFSSCCCWALSRASREHFRFDSERSLSRRLMSLLDLWNVENIQHSYQFHILREQDQFEYIIVTKIFGDGLKNPIL